MTLDQCSRTVVTVCMLACVLGCEQIRPLLPARLQQAMGRFGESVALPPEAVDRAGAWAFDYAMNRAKLSRNPEDAKLVQRICDRIVQAAATTEYAAVARAFQWEVKVLKDDDVVDAFAVPGGKIAVRTGTLRVAGNEARLATVIGHEVVHALARHAVQRMSLELQRASMLSAGSLQLSQGAASKETVVDLAKAMGIPIDGALPPPFSHEHEIEADRMGLILMAGAGYDPHEAIEFWEALQKRTTKTRIPAFLATHPSYDTRLAKLNEMMPEALAVYRQTHSAKADGAAVRR